MRAKRKILAALCATMFVAPLASCGPRYNEKYFSWTDSIKLKKDHLVFAFEHLSPDEVVTWYQFMPSFIPTVKGYSDTFTIPGFETYQDYLPILDYKKTMKNWSWDKLDSLFESNSDCTVGFQASVYDNPPYDKEVFELYFSFDFDNNLVFAWCFYDAYGTLVVGWPSRNGKYHVYKMDDDTNKMWKNHFLEIYENAPKDDEQ